jgi:hypothetical protein
MPIYPEYERPGTRITKENFRGYFLHGTPKREWAMDIYRNGRWLIKDKYFNPPGIYLTTSFTEAKIYAQDHGAIVIVKTARIIPLKQTTPEYWVFEIELFEENEYYSVWGLEPVAVLNTEMVRIA